MRRTTIRLLSLGALLAAAPLLAQQADGAEAIDWLDLGLGMVGGLALFLYGVDLLAGGLKGANGGKFQHLLQRFSSTRLKALASGTAATVALDSSSVVIILMIAIVDAGLVSFSNTLPAILGANIGTTLSSQIFAWNVDEFAPLLLFAGLVWRFVGKGDKAGQMSSILLGIGLVLFGLHLIGEAAAPLEQNHDVIAFLEQLENPLYGVLAGAAVTVAIQSSSAMMGIIITLAGGGIISLPAGLAMMLGAEIGTCADTLVATVGRSRAAVKAGVFHLGFNIVSVGVGLLLIGWLTRFATTTADDTGQQLANAHVLFNVAGALLAMPFVGAASRLLDRLVPERAGPGMSEPVEAVA